MRITVDRGVCTGHGRCWTLAPEVFEADDDGYCSTEVFEVDSGDEAAVAAALRGVKSCPERAIRADE